jgi:hypothetical protein
MFLIYLTCLLLCGKLFSIVVGRAWRDVASVRRCMRCLTTAAPTRDSAPARFRFTRRLRRRRSSTDAPIVAVARHVGSSTLSLVCYSVTIVERRCARAIFDFFLLPENFGNASVGRRAPQLASLATHRSYDRRNATVLLKRRCDVR